MLSRRCSVQCSRAGRGLFRPSHLEEAGRLRVRVRVTVTVVVRVRVRVRVWVTVIVRVDYFLT